jgi:FkbM family methyltransferase
MLRSSIVATKSLLAKSQAFTRFAVFVRNQANTIVRLRLTDSPWVRESGEKWLIEEVGSRCRTFVDVGGNRGTWTELMLASGGEPKKGLIFEPSTSALRMLREKFGARPEVTIIPAAVSDQLGETQFFEENEAGGTSSCVPGYSKPDAVRRVVKTTTVDSSLAEHGMSDVDFMKIDIEGFDLYALRGARKLIDERRVGIIQFEYNESWLGSGSTIHGAVDLLTSAGMEVFLLNLNGLYTPNLALYGEYFGLSNYVALSPAWREKLSSRIRGPL